MQTLLVLLLTRRSQFNPWQVHYLHMETGQKMEHKIKYKIKVDE